jgi:hypothetical protein
MRHVWEKKYMRSFDWKAYGKRSLGSSRPKWEENIKTDVKKWDILNWVHLRT